MGAGWGRVGENPGNEVESMLELGICRKEITVITVVCRIYFDIEVIRIIVFVTHSLVIKNIRYDRASFFLDPPLESCN